MRFISRRSAADHHVDAALGGIGGFEKSHTARPDRSKRKLDFLDAFRVDEPTHELERRWVADGLEGLLAEAARAKHVDVRRGCRQHPILRVCHGCQHHCQTAHKKPPAINRVHFLSSVALKRDDATDLVTAGRATNCVPPGKLLFYPNHRTVSREKFRRKKGGPENRPA